MTAKKAKDVASSMRLPVEIWEEINRLADRKRLSMNQCVVIACEEYCQREAAKIEHLKGK